MYYGLSIIYICDFKNHAVVHQYKFKCKDLADLARNDVSFIVADSLQDGDKR